MAISGLYNASQYEAFVKTRFPQKEIASLVTFGKPFLEAVRKIDDLEGKQTEVPVETDHPQGLGSGLDTIATTAMAPGSSRGIRWAITRAKGYAMLALDGETLMAMRSNDGAWFRQREREVKNILESLGQQFEMMLWKNGYASLGTSDGDPSGNTYFDLVTDSDAINFHEGMYVDFYANSSGNPSGSARAGGPYQVTVVNYDTGRITVSGAIDAAVATGDHAVRAGNSGYVASGTALKGVPAWIPSSDPTDSLFGVTRTNYPQKLGGHRQSWLGSIEETVKALDVKLRRVNQKPKTLWLSYSNFNRLELELGARGIRTEDGGAGKFSRPSLLMTGPGGPVSVKAGPYCPEDAGYLLDMDTWELHHLGGLPHIVQDDGNVAMRIQSLALGAAAGIADGIEMRFRWMANLFCTNPFANGRAAIS